MDPIRTAGVPFALYSVREDLSIDLESLGNHLDATPIFAVFVIHYFGRPQPHLDTVAAMCAKRRIPLIEDCAHCFASTFQEQPVGDIGRFALFSVHKILPTDSGGILQVNENSESIPPLPPRARMKPDVLITWCNADLEAIARIRRRNYDHLAKRTRTIPGVSLLWPELPAGTVPMNLPVLIEGVDRFEVYERLRSKGIGVVSLYHTLADVIDSQEHPVPHRLSRRILNLPIHQDIGLNEINRVADLLRATISDCDPITI